MYIVGSKYENLRKNQNFALSCMFTANRKTWNNDDDKLSQD